MSEVRRTKVLAGQGVELSRATPCVFVVSVGDHGPGLEELRAGWLWTQSRFDTSAILIGDSLHRLTLQASLGLDEAAARDAALRSADRLIDRLASFAPGQLLLRTSELATEPGFAAALLKFEDAFRQIPEFRDAVEQDAAAYCDRQDRRGRLAVPLASAVSLAIRYLLEEVAIYQVIAARGWLVEAYLGQELRVLKAFMHGRFRGVSPELERRVHISLQLERRIQEAA